MWNHEKESENENLKGNSHMLHDNPYSPGKGKNATEKGDPRAPRYSNFLKNQL
jgi:hypothetical protein